MAARSRTSVGLSSRTYRRIPEPSSWKTPIVSPWPSSSNVFASSSGSVSTSSLTPRCFSTRSMASARIVRLMRPRKSNFRRPSASQACISNWVIVVLPSVARWSGMISVSGSREMTIPAAWVEACRDTPSSCFAMPMSLSTRSSPAISSRSCGLVSTARSRQMFSSSGTAFATRSASA